MTDDGRLEALDRQDCLDLLRTVSVGRLAWSDRDGRVQIRPVNFVLDPGPDPGPDTACVLVRCRDGGMLEAVRHGRPVSFEADQLEPALRAGWSVLVVARSVTISTVTDSGDTRLPEPWAGAERPHVLRLTPETITGRRLRLVGGDISVVRLEPDRD
ncbi:MAG: pyridoxamine 5'-phosphate oxidase family protein [Pseudonocardia sp.]